MFYKIQDTIYNLDDIISIEFNTYYNSPRIYEIKLQLKSKPEIRVVKTREGFRSDIQFGYEVITLENESEAKAVWQHLCEYILPEGCDEL